MDAWVDQARTAFLAAYVTTLGHVRELLDERLLSARGRTGVPGAGRRR
ncbi:MAG: hypothetical protein R3C32_15160 [Chloroflexota bacterium]